jgi:FtsH-binding integral membrane protein
MLGKYYEERGQKMDGALFLVLIVIIALFLFIESMIPQMKVISKSVVVFVVGLLLCFISMAIFSGAGEIAIMTAVLYLAAVVVACTMIVVQKMKR